jgi:hypothetical protein
MIVGDKGAIIGAMNDNTRGSLVNYGIDEAIK